MATLPVSTPVRVIDANWSSRLKTEIQATEIATAQRAIEGLLDVQAHTPTKEYRLETTNARIPENNPVTPFKIKIPARHARSRNVSQASVDLTRSIPKQEEDAVAKKVAERALKGLLKAQAVSPSKQYSIDSNIVPEVEETKPPQMLPPTPESTVSQDMPSTPATPNRPYTLAMQEEGTVPALRLQDLGHPFVYAGVTVESPQQETQAMEHDDDPRPNVSPPPQDDAMDAVGTDQPKVPFGFALMDAEKRMEDTSIQLSRSGSEQPDALDAPRTAGPETSLANASGTDERIPDTVPPANAGSDVPIAPTIVNDSGPNPDIVNLRASASMERHPSQALSDLSALTPAPVSEAHISAPASRSVSVTPPFVDANPVIPDILLDLDLTSPRVGGSRSSTPIDHSAVASHKPKRQQTLSNSPEPTITLDESTTEKPEDSLPQLSEGVDEGVDGGDVMEESEVIESPSTASSSLSATQNTSHDIVPIAPTTSQVSSTAEDEDDVQNLLELGHVLSTPIAPSAGHGQGTSELDNVGVEEDTPKTPPRTHSPMIASSYSPEDMRTLRYDAHVDVFEGGGDDAVPGSQADMAQVSPEEPTRSPTPPITYTQDEEYPPSDDVYLGMVDSSPPPAEAAEPESTADEDVLDPEAVLQVKQELDNSTTNGPWTAGVVEAAADKGKKKDSANNAAEPAYIYISDTDQTPVNRPSKKKRASSVIYISSDDDIPVTPLRSTRKSARTGQSDHSAAPRVVDTSAEVLAIKAEEIFGMFDGMNGTSTPVRGRTREVSQIIPNREPERSASPAAASAHSTSRHLLTKELSPVSDLSKSPSPAERAAEHKDDEREGTAPSKSPPPEESGSVAELKKYIAKIDSEDDMPIIPRKKRKVSAVSEAPTEEGPARNTPAESSSAPKKGLLVVPKKGKSTAVTRVKKRKLPTLGPESDEEDQPPLKMAKLRKRSKENDTSVKATGSESKGKGTVSAGSKGKGKMREQPVRSPAKKVKVETPKTPPRLTRGQQARAVKWPHIDRPNYDQVSCVYLVSYAFFIVCFCEFSLFSATCALIGTTLDVWE